MLKATVLLSLVAIATCSLVGGYVDRDENDDDVVLAAMHAAESLSKIFTSHYHHIFHQVIKAESQVVAGTNYRMTIIVVETNCEKDEVEYEDAEACNFLWKARPFKRCHVIVNQNLNDEYKLENFTCIPVSINDI